MQKSIFVKDKKILNSFNTGTTFSTANGTETSRSALLGRETLYTIHLPGVYFGVLITILFFLIKNMLRMIPAITIGIHQNRLA